MLFLVSLYIAYMDKGHKIGISCCSCSCLASYPQPVQLNLGKPGNP